MDIFNILQDKIDEIVAKKYEHDNCPPEFIVSLIQRTNIEGKIDQHEIGLTCKHMDQAYTRTLFPQLDMKYGYTELESEIEWLYNCTM